MGLFGFFLGSCGSDSLTARELGFAASGKTPFGSGEEDMFGEILCCCGVFFSCAEHSKFSPAFFGSFSMLVRVFSDCDVESGDGMQSSLTDTFRIAIQSLELINNELNRCPGSAS